MLAYISGFSHAVIIACLLFVLHPAMEKDRNLAPVPDFKPYALVYQDDCYIPNGKMESEVLPMTLIDVEGVYK